jgi:hypothetical protein
MWLNLKCVVMINIVSTLFTLYLCLCLLSPQHFTQENLANRTNKQPIRTPSLTSGQDHILSWADQQFNLTAPLTSGSNIALINSSAGYNQFASFMNLVDEPDKPVVFFGHHLIPNDDNNFNADQPALLTNNLFDQDEDILQVNAPTNEGENEGGHEGG